MTQMTLAVIAFGIAIPFYVGLVLWLRKAIPRWVDNMAKRNAESYTKAFDNPEVIGFAEIDIVKDYDPGHAITFVSMGNASNPAHKKLAIVVKLSHGGCRYAVIGDGQIHCVDLLLQENVKTLEWGGSRRSHNTVKYSKYHEAVFAPMIEAAFRDDDDTTNTEI